jgi:sugar lactone lactonase YvrE
VNNEERRLADLLHRMTPEPPRPVTVEQVAYRMVSEPRPNRQSWGRQTPGRQTRGREPRPRRGGLVLSRSWAPVLAAAAVIVIAGASAGIAVLASSHHSPPTPAVGAPSSSSVSSPPVSASQTSPSTQQTTPTTAIAGGPWGAELINRQSFAGLAPVSADGSLYAYGAGTLDRIDPVTGAVAATTRYDPPLPNPPVIVGNTVWVVSSYHGGNVVLHGYDAQTLAQTASVLVPAVGAVSSAGDGVLTSGPDGDLYVAAGVNVVKVNPANGQQTREIYLTAGSANSVAVSPDGSTLYIGTVPSGSSTSFKLLVYSLASRYIVNESSLSSGGVGGDLVATPGGVWGVTGSGQSEWTWFAPNGDLTSVVRVGGGGGGGFVSAPSYSAGVVWIGGSQSVTCASPDNGQILATAAVPGDHGVAELISSPAVVGGRAYSYYVNNETQLSGLARMTPPAVCSGLSS